MKLYRRFLATYLCVCLIPLVFSLAQVVGMRQEIQRSIAKYSPQADLVLEYAPSPRVTIESLHQDFRKVAAMV